jgi:hypothetical protein
MARIGKLTALKADKVKAYGDGGGLFLQVSRYGTKSWVFRFKGEGPAARDGLRLARHVQPGRGARTGTRAT